MFRWRQRMPHCAGDSMDQFTLAHLVEAVFDLFGTEPPRFEIHNGAVALAPPFQSTSATDLTGA